MLEENEDVWCKRKGDSVGMGYTELKMNCQRKNLKRLDEQEENRIIQETYGTWGIPISLEILKEKIVFAKHSFHPQLIYSLILYLLALKKNKKLLLVIWEKKRGLNQIQFFLKPSIKSEKWDLRRMKWRALSGLCLIWSSNIVKNICRFSLD